MCLVGQKYFIQEDSFFFFCFVSLSRSECVEEIPFGFAEFIWISAWVRPRSKWMGLGCWKRLSDEIKVLMAELNVSKRKILTQEWERKLSWFQNGSGISLSLTHTHTQRMTNKLCSSLTVKQVYYTASQSFKPVYLRTGKSFFFFLFSIFFKVWCHPQWKLRVWGEDLLYFHSPANFSSPQEYRSDSEECVRK